MIAPFLSDSDRRELGRTLLLAAAVLTAAAYAQEFQPGAPIADFDLTDLDGKPARYSALKGDTTVVVFISTVCPISNGYNERMKAVYRDYTAKSVHFIFINANSTESAADVAAHAKTHAFPFAVYKDPNGVAANLFDAQVTPETYVIDRAGTIRYHGYIDDSLNPARIHNQGLRHALDAVLEGKPVSAAQTKAFGCTIKRRRKVS
jgi:peroxiredoxin